MGSTEIVIVAIGAVVSVAAALEVWKYWEYDWREESARTPYTVKSTLLPVVCIGMIGTVIVLVSPHKGEALFGTLLLLELFAPIFIVLGRSSTQRKGSVWSP